MALSCVSSALLLGYIHENVAGGGIEEEIAPCNFSMKSKPSAAINILNQHTYRNKMRQILNEIKHTKPLSIVYRDILFRHHAEVGCI